MIGRRLARLAWLALLPLPWADPRGPVPAARASEPDTLTSAYEVSGVHVIQRVSPASDVVAVRLYLLGGTRQITAATAGTEVLFLKASEYGTAEFTGGAAHRAAGSVGARFTIEADADWTVFGFTGLAQDFDAAWQIFAERLMHPTLSDAAVEQARGKLLTAARRRYTEPDERIHLIAMQALFRDHPYAIDPYGTPESLSRISAATVRTYAHDQVVTSRMLLVVVGNATRAHVESLVGATLGQLPPGDYRWALPPPPPQRQSGWLIENRQLPTTYLLAYFVGPPPTSHRYWAFRVATAILSSRLYLAIRVRRSLSYDAYAPYLDGGIPVGGAYVSTRKPDSALSVMIDQINGLRQCEADYASLARFINGFTFDYIAENASAESQADFLARAQQYLGDYRQGAEFLRRLRSVQPYDLCHVTTEYVTHLQFAYLGDTARMHGTW